MSLGAAPRPAAAQQQLLLLCDSGLLSLGASPRPAAAQNGSPAILSNSREFLALRALKQKTPAF